MALVERLALRQLPTREIARLIGCDEKSLRYRFSAMIDAKRAEGRSNLLLAAYGRALKGNERLLQFMISRTMKEDFGESLKIEGSVETKLSLDEKKLSTQFLAIQKKLRSLPALKNVSPKLIEMREGEKDA